MECLGSNTAFQDRQNEGTCLERKWPFPSLKHHLQYEDVTNLVTEAVVLFSFIA